VHLSEQKEEIQEVDEGSNESVNYLARNTLPIIVRESMDADKPADSILERTVELRIESPISTLQKT
jgi:hypothetical protein